MTLCNSANQVAYNPVIVAHKQKLPRAKAHQSAVEWTFPKAHRYWDASGSVIAGIEAAFPGLECKGLDERQGFRFEGEKGLSAATFFWNKASIMQVGLGDDALGTAAARFWDIVSTGLSVSSVQRFGHRSWLIFETESPQESLRWLEGLDVWRFGEMGNSQDIGTPKSAGIVLRTRLSTLSREMRLELNAGSVTWKAKEICGVLADVDLSMEAPDVTTDFGAAVDEDVQFLRESIDPFIRAK